MTLTVTDDAGNTATATQTVTTTGPVPNQAPLASFTATPSSGNVPLFVAFDAAGSTDSDGTIDNYDWTFDDGATATGVSVNHEFVDPGTYAVTLTVTDNEGETGMVTSLVAAGVAAPIVDVRVSAGDDDAEESQSGSMSRSSSDLELADEGSNTGQTIGMRFVGVDIPPGATIVDAYVQFQVDEADSGAVSLEIRGQAADDAVTFTGSSGDISTRPTTSAAVSWSPPPWPSVGAAGADQRTPDLSEVVQEIIDRTDWSRGNALAIIITGTGERTAESYNGKSSAAPQLHVEYISPPGG